MSTENNRYLTRESSNFLQDVNRQGFQNFNRNKFFSMPVVVVDVDKLSIQIGKYKNQVLCFYMKLNYQM